MTLPSAELQPLGVPSAEGDQPLGIPSGDGPYLDDVPADEHPQDSAFPTAAAESPSVPTPPARRGSTLMFLVGGIVGLVLALSVVILGDHFANEGALRATLTKRLNTLLAPYDIEVPTFEDGIPFLDELMGEGGAAVADGGAAPVGNAKADGGAAAPAPAPAADAGVKASNATAEDAKPVVLTAERSLIVVSVIKSKGDAVKEGDPLLGVAMGDDALLDKKLKLEKERRSVSKKAKRRGRRGKRARRRLKAINAELGKLLRELENTKLAAPAAGVVDEVLAKTNVVLAKGTELVRIAPAKALPK